VGALVAGGTVGSLGGCLRADMENRLWMEQLSSAISQRIETAADDLGSMGGGRILSVCMGGDVPAWVCARSLPPARDAAKGLVLSRPPGTGGKQFLSPELEFRTPSPEF
jgi:hypothetical protein